MPQLTFPHDPCRDISGRYLHPDSLARALDNLHGAKPEILGHSVRGLPVKGVTLGTGKVRVLMWSQMHGNETTTTKAVVDLMLYLLSGDEHAARLLRTLQICIIPMLNPDGAVAYTRENANGVDLNRDAAELSQPESRILASRFDAFGPDFCFNLHDQRTIYNVGKTPVPATLSFLAPSADRKRSVPPGRLAAMRLIAAITSDLSGMLPGGIGRYDDSYNPNCVGDRFQRAGTPTVLFEAGHFPGDYQREQTRFFAFQALVSALGHIADGNLDRQKQSDYEQIPENRKWLVDILIENPHALNPGFRKGKPAALHFREVLEKGRISFVPEWPEEGLSEARFGLRKWDASHPVDVAELQKQPGLLQLLLNR